MTSNPPTIQVIRAVAAAGILGAVLIGVPAVLVAAGYAPRIDSTDWQVLIGARPDWGDGLLLETVLPAIAWTAWALVAVPWLIEIATHARSRPSRPLVRPLRAQQVAAVVLIAAISTGLTAVRSGTAEPLPHQHTGTDSPSLTLVENTRHTAAQTLAGETGTTARSRTYRVRAGDTLWAIADRFLGTGTAFPQIARASRTIEQPGGRHLTDPDLILPGWTVAVPPTHPPTTPRAESQHAPTGGDTTGHTTHPVPKSPTPALPTTGETDAAPDNKPSPAAAPAAERAMPRHNPSTETAKPWIVDFSGPLGETVMGVLAAGLISFLTVQRLARRRRRAPGAPIEPATPNGGAVETRFRAREDPLNAVHLDRALRALNTHLETRDAPAPLVAVRTVGSTVTLYFDAPVQLTSPFTRLGEEAVTWAVDAAMLDASPSTTVLCPALVTIGSDAEGATVLLNLEQVSAIQISGSDSALTKGLLTAMLLELATNDWSRDVTITTTSQWGRLAKSVNSARVRIAADDTTAIRLLRAELNDRNQALDSYGLPDVATARHTDADGAWGPHILVRSATAQAPAELPAPGPTARKVGLIILTTGAHAATGGASAARIEVSSPTSATFIDGDHRLDYAPQLVGPTVEAILEPLFANGTPTGGADGNANRATTDRAVALERSIDVTATPGPLGNDITAQDRDDRAGPYLRLLGPVDMLGLPNTADLPARGLELIAYLHTQSQPISGAQIQAALWPDTYDPHSNNTRTLAKQVRSALGTAADGQLLLPEGRRGTGFTIHPCITSDWAELRRLVGTELRTADDDSLTAALRLVRGAPFAGTAQRRGWWSWRAPLEETMIANVLDVTVELAKRAVQRRDRSHVRLAATVARTVDPLNEAGWRIELQLARADGDTESFNRILDEVYTTLGRDDPDYTLDAATQTLVDQARAGRLPGTAGG